jgi:dissimilatory sulfite reductase (desulfoviridin) alpha/beta subunit
MKLADEYKANGFIAQKQQGYYAARIRTRAGNMTSAHLLKVAQLADKYGQGYVHFTTRQSVEIPGVLEASYMAIMQEIGEAGLLSAVCGSRIRTIVACPGTAYCRSGLMDTVSLTSKLDMLFVGQELPAKTKIGISSCPNSCAKPQENDIGLQGAVTIKIKNGCVGCKACVKVCKVKAISVKHKQPVINLETCVNCGKCAAKCPKKVLIMKSAGYNIYIGGKIGRRPKLGTKIFRTVAEAEIIDHVSGILNVYKQLASKDERIAETLERLGLKSFQTKIIEEITRIKESTDEAGSGNRELGTSSGEQ